MCVCGGCGVCLWVCVGGAGVCVCVCVVVRASCVSQYVSAILLALHPASMTVCKDVSVHVYHDASMNARVQRNTVCMCVCVCECGGGAACQRV